jgi:hypothetical protein
MRSRGGSASPESTRDGPPPPAGLPGFVPERFTFEAKPELGLPGLGGLKHLHGDGAPQRSLLRLIDGGHGALPEDFLDDEIVTQRILQLV